MSSLSEKDIGTAQKLFKTALTYYALESTNSKLRSNNCSRPDLPLNTGEEDLLQDLLTVPSKNSSKDAKTQVEHSSTKFSKSVNDDLFTEIDMPLEFQRFLKHFFIAKADSDSPIYEKDWSVSDIGTIDNLEQKKANPSATSTRNQKVKSLSKEFDIFASIRSEVGDIAYRAKESIMVGSLKNPVSTVIVEDTPSVETFEDFRTKIGKRLQQMTLADTSPAPKVISAYNELSVKHKHLNKEETLLGDISTSSPVKVTVSPNHFSMKGPWLEHTLAFHSMKANRGSISLVKP